MNKRFPPALEPDTSVRDDPRWTEPGYLASVRFKGRLAALFVRTWSSTVRLERHGCDREAAAKRTGRPILYLAWHGSQVVPLFAFSNRGILIMTSLSRDGDIQTMSMSCLGYRTLRGSSSRGGAKALLGMIREMNRGFDASLMVDGPRGPYHVAKPGAVLLAQKSRALVLPVGVGYDRVIRLNNWDRFEIPIPFSRVVVATGEAFEIGPDVGIEDGAHLIEERISATEAEAVRRIAA
ncbi:MAG TPA: lysophospholipid acyltransferase family protein [Candidatus Ozemobacteraceae bacterium]|nr:lysophospholipid acyltransferase family protein [Candidatus Ozemobacteraceae bacterium]